MCVGSCSWLQLPADALWESAGVTAVIGSLSSLSEIWIAALFLICRRLWDEPVNENFVLHFSFKNIILKIDKNVQIILMTY